MRRGERRILLFLEAKDRYVTVAEIATTLGYKETWVFCTLERMYMRRPWPLNKMTETGKPVRYRWNGRRYDG